MGALAMEWLSPTRGAHPVGMVGSDAMACVGMASITVRSHKIFHQREELRKASSPKVALNRLPPDYVAALHWIGWQTSPEYVVIFGNEIWR